MLRPKPVLPNPGIMVFISGKSSPNGRKIQVSEILWFTQMYVFEVSHDVMIKDVQNKVDCTIQRPRKETAPRLGKGENLQGNPWFLRCFLLSFFEVP